MKYYRQTKLSCFILASLVLMSCSPKIATKAPPTKMACHVETQALDIRDNGKGRTLAKSILLADIERTPTTIGYGPALNPKAEITILDGNYYLTQPDGINPETHHQPADGQGATFIVTADAGVWMEGAPLPDVVNLQDISKAIGTYAKLSGCEDISVFPFKIKAHAKTLTWSITGSPKSLKGITNDVDMIIVGIYDNSGEPRNAIMSGLDIHPHVVIASHNLSGHLNAVTLDPGAMLFVPKPQD